MNEQSLGAGQEVTNLWQVLEVFVPSEEIVVLNLLLVGHLQQVVVELGKHEEIGEGKVVSNEKGSTLQVLLQMLNHPSLTFFSYFPSFR